MEILNQLKTSAADRVPLKLNQDEVIALVNYIKGLEAEIESVNAAARELQAKLDPPVTKNKNKQ